MQAAMLPTLVAPRILLPRQQRHARRRKRSRNPPPPVHLLMQKDFCGDGVADEGEGSGGPILLISYRLRIIA
jgi:hypothetical protein